MIMDATEGALALLDCLERDDLAALERVARELRQTRVVLKNDGLELIDRAVALDRWPALRPLLMLGASDQPDVLFGVWCHDFLTQRAKRCFDSGRMRTFLELLALGAHLPSVDHNDVLVERVAEAALVEFAMEDEGVLAIVNRCQTQRGAFLVRALRLGRSELVRQLAGLCTSSQNYGANRRADGPLVAAAEAGAAGSLRALVEAGAKPNVALRGSGYPLHFAVRCTRLSAADRGELVHELLRLGAVPELRDAHGLDAYALAASLQDSEVSRVLREHGRSYGPRQSREARARGVRDVCLLYDKADGLIYRIGQPDVPFMDGGDYDGPIPCSVTQFRTSYEQVRKRRPGHELDWFEPFLVRLENNQEFAYADFLKRASRISLKRFDETSNWSQMVD